VDIVVKGRNVDVPARYRQHVAEKLHKVERYDGKIIRVDVELFHERNPRQSGTCQRVEITCASRGPVVRAEASSGDFYSALDLAMTKLDARLRRFADRRRVHRGRRAPVSVAAATSGLDVASDDLVAATVAAQAAAAQTASAATADARAAAASTNGSAPEGHVTQGYAPFDDTPTDEFDDQPWHIVREKEHPTEPMTVDDALFQMEMVGHDFFLFMDKESGRPSVVYRRHAYDYGVIALAS
jgi:ribosomal subunit interface protein